MTHEDIPTVLDIGQSVDGFRVSPKTADFWSKDQLHRWVDSDDVLLVAEYEKKIVGFILTAHHKPTGKVTWENQVVLPNFRGRGIGAALTNEMENRLIANGATYIHFLVKDTNPHLTHYQKIGYDTGHTFVWFGKNV